MTEPKAGWRPRSVDQVTIDGLMKAYEEANDMIFAEREKVTKLRRMLDVVRVSLLTDTTRLTVAEVEALLEATAPAGLPLSDAVNPMAHSALEQPAAEWVLPLGWLIPLDATPTNCRSCGARVLFGQNEKSGKFSPFDPHGPDEFSKSHFASCPEAASWRKKVKR